MDKQAAYRKVRTALKNGLLTRPSICERCGESPGQASDGRSKIQAHHHDYSRPLDVEWICAKCHREETPLPDAIGGPAIGSINGQSRLDETKVRDIRNSNLGCRRLSAMYGVDKKTIQRVRNGKIWRHV